MMIITKISKPSISQVGTSNYYLITMKDEKTKKSYHTHAFTNSICWKAVIDAGVGSVIDNVKIIGKNLVDGYSQPIVIRRIS